MSRAGRLIAAKMNERCDEQACKPLLGMAPHHHAQIEPVRLRALLTSLVRDRPQDL